MVNDSHSSRATLLSLSRDGGVFFAGGVALLLCTLVTNPTATSKPAESPVHVNTGPSEDIVAADLNRDRWPDAIVVNFAGQKIRVLLGDGRGHLAEKQTITVQGNPVRVGLGDFSGDGILDLAVVLRSVATSTPGILAFYRGGGFGQFTLTHTISVGDPTSITIADVDLDGNPDIILSMYHENKRQLLYGNGSIVFDPPVDLDIGPNPYATAVADINGDR